MPVAKQNPGIRRWEGLQRVALPWDSLRRDPELWFPDGDCLIYLYGEGQSRRGPSFCVPLDAIYASESTGLLEQFGISSEPVSPNTKSSISCEQSLNKTATTRNKIYIPASGADSSDHFRYHLSTRNFFAWMFGKPLVGEHLGPTLVELLERMDSFRGAREDNIEEILEYLQGESFTDFRNCPDYALALLYFAEHVERKDLWTEAFVHCVGMNDILISSTEYESISRVSKALITRAKLEMDIRLEQAAQSLSSFFEEDFDFLKLDQTSRNHLERYRSFLHSYHIRKFGFWPPRAVYTEGSSFSKTVIQSMYFDFRKLYEYLADTDSFVHTWKENASKDGIGLLQNIALFNKKRRYKPLPHPLPLIPDTYKVGFVPKPIGPKARALSLITRTGKAERKISTLIALRNATNTYDQAVMECPLVVAYEEFERDCAMKEEEKLSCEDARKIRWLLTYAIFQTLVSVTMTPREVRDTEGVTYDLCVETAGTPPWENHRKPSEKLLDPEVMLAHEKLLVGDSLLLTTDGKPATAAGSVVTITCPKPVRPAFCEILIEGYGNGLTGSLPELIPLPPDTPNELEDLSSTPTPTPSSSSAGHEHEQTTTPTPDTDSPPSLIADSPDGSGNDRSSGESQRTPDADDAKSFAASSFYGDAPPEITEEARAEYDAIRRFCKMDLNRFSKELEEASTYNTEVVEPWVNPELREYLGEAVG